MIYIFKTIELVQLYVEFYAEIVLVIFLANLIVNVFLQF